MGGECVSTVGKYKSDGSEWDIWYTLFIGVYIEN